MEKFDNEKNEVQYYINVTKTLKFYPLHKLGEKPHEPKITSRDFPIKKGKFKFQDIQFEISNFEEDKNNYIHILHLKIYTYFMEKGFEQTLIDNSTFSFFEPHVCDATMEYTFKF